MPIKEILREIMIIVKECAAAVTAVPDQLCPGSNQITFLAVFLSPTRLFLLQ